MAEFPKLKQFAEFRSADFEAHAVWIACHVADYDEPWYDDTDEETFRPFADALPVSRSDELLLVRATALLDDGTEYPGFVTPSLEPSLSAMQPHVFVGSEMFGFWGGIVGLPDDYRNEFHSAVGKTVGEIFPIVFTAASDVTSEVISVRVDGWSAA